jgi:hypothetical protein
VDSSFQFIPQAGNRSINPGVAPTQIIPIEAITPETRAAAIEQREQRKEELNAKIEIKDTEISNLGTDSDSARLRTELEALRAEMVAERARNERELAEIKSSRSNGSDVVANTADANGESPARVANNRVVHSGAAIAGGSGLSPGISRGPAAIAPEGTREFNNSKVETNFSSAPGATRAGGLIQAAKSLPQVQSQDPAARISLRVGDASYPVSDIKSFVLPAGELVEENIVNLIRAQMGQIPLDADNRAFVEIRHPSETSSVVVYVRINGSEIEFLDANPPGSNDGVRATLLDLESKLREVVPQS